MSPPAAKPTKTGRERGRRETDADREAGWHAIQVIEDGLEWLCRTLRNGGLRPGIMAPTLLAVAARELVAIEGRDRAAAYFEGIAGHIRRGDFDHRPPAPPTSHKLH